MRRNSPRVILERSSPFGSQVLPQQPVGALVAAALPRRVWISEMDGDPGGEREARVCRHLGTLVPRNYCAEAPRAGADGTSHHVLHSDRRAIRRVRISASSGCSKRSRCATCCAGYRPVSPAATSRMTSPGHGGDDHTVLWAAHARRRTRTPITMVAGSPSSPSSTATSSTITPCTPSPGSAAAGKVGGDGVFSFSPLSTHPRIGQESPKGSPRVCVGDGLTGEAG